MAAGKILIVDDDVSDATKLKLILRKNNFEVLGLIFDACDAIQQAGLEKPDLILMKLGICGKVSSIEAALKITENYRVPVLFIIGEDDISLLDSIKTFNDPVIVIKPYSDDELINSIALALNRHRALEKSRQKKLQANIDPTETGLNSILAPAITINKRGAVTRINKEMELATGFGKNELLGRKFLSLIAADDIKDSEDEVHIWPDCVLLKKSDESLIRVSVVCGFLKTPGDNLDEQILVFKKEADDIGFPANDIDRIFAMVLNSIDDIVFVLNTKMEITHYNKKFSELAKKLSITSFQLSRPAYEIPQFSKIAGVNLYEELFKNASEVKQIRRFGNAKEGMYMLFRFIPLKTQGEVTHMITVMRDITDIEEAKQKSGAIYEEFMKNSNLLKNIHTAMGDIRTALYQIVRYVEKNPDKLKDPSFEKVAQLARNAEQKLIIFDSAWSKYELQLNMIKMNVKSGFDKK